MPVRQTYKHLLISTRSHLRTIQLNRPRRKNAICREMYEEIKCALNDAANDDNVVIAAITGAGDYYSSGNDLKDISYAEDIDEAIKTASKSLQNFLRAFYAFPKILVAVVNGPAIGIAVTTLGLCDMVYASDRATFSTPFTSLGLSVEGGASYTFPKIMGYSKASELLYFNKTFTAKEAKECRLVAEVFPHETLSNSVWPELEKLSNLPPQSMGYSKTLVRSYDKEILDKVVAAECKRLEERWQSEEFLNAIIAFSQKKSKL